MFKYIISILLGVMMTAQVHAADVENTIYLETIHGRIVIELLPEKAPKHVERIKELSRAGFYNDIVFHRVIDGFMAQTGDPTGTGMGSSDKPDLKAEFNDVSHKRGVVSMARAANPHSANSQFFIVLEDSPFLDRQYTAFGRVTSGMEHVDAIKKGNKQRNGEVSDPDKIVTMTVAADVEKTE
ncbi:MAG: peptidylprolyl isomerase [Sphaerospermopsis sp. SIO1G2]|nr:peptidylprolyl isomerase [Sphaerospermopsis sp. SIO1G2]